jgi:hypothetical protein
MRSTLNIPDPDLPRAQRLWGRWPAVTVGVLLAHWGLLHALPSATIPLQPQDAQPVAMTFTTRTIMPVAQDVVRQEAPSRTVKTQAQPTEFKRIRPLPLVEPEQRAPDLIANTEASPAMTNQDAPDLQLAAATTVTETPTPASTKPSETQALQNYAIPGSVRLKYEVRGEKSGIPVFANGELLWVQDGKTYEARMEISILMFGRVQTSKGQLGAHGLEPLRFGDKVRSEVAAHFDRSKGKVTFSANTPDVAMLPGAQDQLSIFMHVASMIGGDPRRFPPGTELSFQAIGPRSAETWAFTVGNLETLTLPGGTIKALKLSRPPANEYSPRADVWLAPEMAYMPVRIRLKEANGDIADQQWSATQKP